MLWPKALPLDLDFGLCAWAKLFNNGQATHGARMTHASRLGQKKKKKTKILGEKLLRTWEFPRSGSKAKDGEKKKD